MMNAVNNVAAALAANSGKSEGGLVKATVVRGPTGEGVFTLRLSGGREIGVQAEDGASGAMLSLGQKVLVNPSDGKIFIPVEAAGEQPTQSQQWLQSQQPAQERQSAQMLLQQVQGGDEFVSGKQTAEASANGGGVDGAEGEPQTGLAGLAKIVGFKVVSEGEAHADGIYRADAAGHIIEGPADGEAPIKDFTAVRLNTVNGQQVVTVISGDGLSAALEELRGSFESPLLKALPLDVLKDIFNERGFIDTDTLKALDAALANRNLSIDASSPFQMERIGQWLRIALDNPGMAQELVDRIPALGAKDAAGLLELIGRLSAGVAPESFFATENALSSIGTNVGSVNLLQNLIKAAFSAAPDALLNLVKRIDTSNVVLGAQLPQTEAARIVREITNAIPAQAAAKPGSLHDAGQLSPRVLTADVPQPQTTQTPASAVLRIRAEYSALTETTVRALLGGGKADAAAIGEKINALRAAVERIPVDNINTNSTNNQRINSNSINNSGIDNHSSNNSTNNIRINNIGINNNSVNNNSNNNANNIRINNAGINTNSINNNGKNNSDNGINNTTAARESAGSGNRAEKISPSINIQPAVSTAKVPEASPHINAQLAVHRTSVQQFGDVNASVGNGGINTKATDAFPAVNRGFVPQQTAAPQTNRVGAGINANSVNVISTDVNNIRSNNVSINSVSINNTNNNAVNTNNTNANGINNSINSNINTNIINANRANVNSINNNINNNVNNNNTNNINPTSNQNTRSDTGIGINRPVFANNSPDVGKLNNVGINTNNKNYSDNQNTRVDLAASINRLASVNKSTPVGINPINTAPPNVPAIKENCLSIVDTLKSSAAPILRELSQRGEVSAGGSASLIGHVRNAVASLDEALRPLVRSERPVPPEFYERVATNAGHKISAEARNALFSQIGSAQTLIRGAMEAVERVNATGANVRANGNTNTGTSINSNISAGINTNINPSINTNNYSNVTPNVNANINTNVNTGVNPSINANINTNINTGTNAAVDSGINANTGNVNTNINPNPNADNANADVNPNINANNANLNNVAVAAASDNRPDEFLQIARRIWANTEKLRAGFREAFSTLDLQNRASPLDQPADDTTAGAVRRSADSLRTEMLLDVSKALRDVFSSVDELREIVSLLSSGQKALPEVEAALLRAVQALEHQARQSGTDVMERLKDVLRELNRLQADAARAQEQGLAAGAASRSSPTEAIRAAALTAARSLENLQLLSAQTRTAETEQHLLAIPAKIGGEWTEVQIKFVKERKGEKGENKDGHVSIYLNVAPSALGQVTAHLDYHPPNLKLAFQFEKPEVTRWFRQQSGELREALSQVGLPGTVLEFYNKRPIGKDPAAPPRPSPVIDNDGVDSADGFEIKNGRVDFKI